VSKRGGYKPKDHFFQKAKDEGLRARSAFKIDEIAARFALFPKGARVLDLGAAPGGFLQILAREVGPKGFIVGVDLVPIRALGLPNVKTAVGDVLADDFDAQLEALHPETFDAVVSDLAPKTTGVRDTDEARSLRLAGKALEISLRKGTPRVSYVAKLFMGRDFESFRDEVRAGYQDVKVVRPEATRGASIEVYIVGMKRKL
jgi:23S rRNA (uridine2552-2'-O)-methyltransferase